MDLLGDDPILNLADRNFRIYSRNTARPPQYLGLGAEISNSLISEGCIINGKVVNSVLSGGVVVETGATVRDSVIMDDVVIKKNATVNSAIIDANAKVDVGASVGVENAGRDEITVIARGSVVKAVSKNKGGKK